MARKLVLFLLATLASCSYGLMIKRAIVPHNCQPGYVISSLTFWGQDFSLTSPDRMDIQKFFTILTNGDIITNSDVKHLLGEKIPIVVKSLLGSHSWKDALHLDIQNGDNLLLFSQQLYEGEIMENQPKETTVIGLEDITAQIKNVKMPVHYEIYSGDSVPFELKTPKSNVKGLNRVQVITTEPLDREVKEKFLITIKATTDKPEDEPVFAKVRITILDENDNIPSFADSSGHVSIQDTIPALSPVFTVSATDPDKGQIQYYIDPSNELFFIEPTTGRIILNSRVNLNPQIYVLTIYAKDSGDQKSTPFTLTINVEGTLKFEPHIEESHSRKKREVRSLKEVEIPEIYSGNLLTLESAPNDRFAIKEPCPENLEIHPITGTVRVRGDTKLDYEKTKEIDFVVIITRTDDESCEY